MRTYGYLKVEPLIGIFSSAVIGYTAFEIGWEAIKRVMEQAVMVPGLLTMGLAVAGLAANVINALILHRYRDDNLSVKGAFLHALMDALGSVGIIASSLMVYLLGWGWADAAVGAFIVALILHTAWGLAKSSWHVLLDGVPEGVGLVEVEQALAALPGVRTVYDLHFWSLSSTERAMTAHLYIDAEADGDAVLRAATTLARERFKARHITFQIDRLPIGPAPAR